MRRNTDPMQKEIIMRALSRKLALAAVAAPIGAAALIATACTSSSHTTSPGGPSSGAGSAASASSVTVKTQIGALGSFLADGSGRALYLFASDTSSTSNCSGACATLWPPLTAKGSVSASGDASGTDIATITRQDGAKQVTYAGHPLYYFAGDGGAGHTNGQGVNEFGALWWLVAPSGQKITTSDSAAPSMNSGYNGGY
jgi:predicted lipoprotein with Yx(FWY)xxD motif